MNKLHEHMRYSIFLILVIMTSSVWAGDSSGVSTYRMGAGDVINIQVYDEPDLSFQVRLSDAGTINYPFLGELKLSGMFVREVEDLITSGLKGRYLIHPKVTVRIADYRPFYVDGEVRSPGSYPYTPGLTVQKAISIAGGFNERASRSKIYIIPEGGREEDRRKVDLISTINPGDILVVEESFF